MQKTQPSDQVVLTQYSWCGSRSEQISLNASLWPDTCCGSRSNRISLNASLWPDIWCGSRAEQISLNVTVYGQIYDVVVGQDRLVQISAQIKESNPSMPVKP